MTPFQTFSEILQRALDSPNGVVIEHVSSDRLRAARMGLYRARNKDRKIQQKIFGPTAESRFDVLYNTLNFDPTTGLWSLHIYRERDFLSSLSRATKIEGLDLDVRGTQSRPRR